VQQNRGGSRIFKRGFSLGHLSIVVELLEVLENFGTVKEPPRFAPGKCYCKDFATLSAATIRSKNTLISNLT
jgi:hypothetical protein